MRQFMEPILEAKSLNLWYGPKTIGFYPARFITICGIK